MKKLLYISILILTLNACKKENNANSFQGNYQGTFRTRVNYQFSLTDAEIVLSNPTFTVLKGPKLANGTFKVDDKMHITFIDKNLWTADFDWNILLNGQYKYEALGDSLILTKYVGGPADALNYYQYRLKRVKQ